MDKIDEVLTRGVANIIPGRTELERLLKSGKKLNVYLGIDPTTTKIHLGHTVGLRKLQQFADLGHNVTFLIGDYTALIGDTSDKDSERPSLTSEEIEENFQTYKKQAEKVLDFSKVKVKYNSEWLKKLTYEEILKLNQHFSVNNFLSRELIKKRLSEGKSVGLHEFSYPVMQGYDSYILDTDIQIGGTDQTFNMQAGRTLQKDLRQKESFVISTPILEGPDGRKMSKSWGNTIWLDDNPNDMYAKIMAVEDRLITIYFILTTSVSLKLIQDLEKRLKSENPINIKKELAHVVVTELYDKKFADTAQKKFERTVQNKKAPTELEEVEVTPNSTVFDVLTGSNSEKKRLIEQGGVYLNDKRVTDPNQKAEAGTLKTGKRRFVKIVIK